MKKIIILLLFIFLMIPQASANASIMPTWAELEDLGAFDPINNLQSNASALAAYNISDNFLFQTLTYDENKTEYENALTFVTFPIAYGASEDFIGAWFWVFLEAVVLIFVYGKTKSIENTTAVMLICSLIVVLASAGGAVVLPAVVMGVFYVLTILGFFGVLYSMFGE